MIHNPNCDGDKCRSNTGEVRRLPTGGDGAAILCRACFDNEIRFRRERNEELAPSVSFDLPSWQSLEAYTGA
jgi:hypothetical protein